MIKKTSNKNTSFLIAVVFIAMISVALAAVALDIETKNYLDEQNDPYTGIYSELQKKLDALNKTLSSLGTDLKDVNNDRKDQADDLKDIQGAGASKEDYLAANQAYAQKAEELNKVLPEFESRYDDNEFDIDEGIVYDTDYFNYTRKLEQDALTALFRAQSVADQDKIIADFKAALEAIPTRVKKIYNALDELEKDGITVSDRENIEEVIRLLTFIPAGYSQADVDKLFAFGEKDELIARFNTSIEAYAPVMTDYFVEIMKTLPEYTSINNEETIKKAEETLAYIRTFFPAQTDENVLRTYYKSIKKGSDYDKLAKALPAYRARLNELLVAKKAAEQINAEIAKFDISKIDSSAATLTQIDKFMNLINEWASDPHHNIVSDPEQKDYVADNYNMVNVSTVDSYYAKFYSLTNGLADKVNALIAAVNKLPDHITPDSAKLISDAKNAWKTMWTDIANIKNHCLKNLPSSKEYAWSYNEKFEEAVAEIDYILGYTGEKADEGLKAALETTRNAESTLNYITAQLDRIASFVKSFYPGAVLKDMYAYKLDVVKANNNEFKSYDNIIYDLLYVKEIEEEHFDADVLNAYKTVRYAVLYDEVCQAIKAEFNNKVGTVYEAKAYALMNDLLDEAKEAFEEYYAFEAKVEMVNGKFEYTGFGEWAEETSKVETNLNAILAKIATEFANLEKPIISN